MTMGRERDRDRDRKEGKEYITKDDSFHESHIPPL